MRFARRALALGALPDRLAALLAAEPEPSGPAPDGIGEGRAETAHGALRHRVQLAGGLVWDWEIAVPADRNFHPEGPAAKGLLGAVAGPHLAGAAAWHLAAFDPGMPTAIRIVAAAEI
ncbi:hypothetical protein [Paracraurococcus ruber]|uniref:Uncharacterized protein n=1 Tax=Paracraurococcus ruber TaxID=77675 RepID=A0ABS1CSE0_9PROT|nr:hypothetical protein [Paracraurococcus ruber]MBK1657202.1 hypothetical protein [Paracraurococcus ruber]TDG11187.1 hypothetical protein E2C05_30985 [Paracraurococcus ruber]